MRQDVFATEEGAIKAPPFQGCHGSYRFKPPSAVSGESGGD